MYVSRNAFLQEVQWRNVHDMQYNHSQFCTSSESRSVLTSLEATNDISLNRLNLLHKSCQAMNCFHIYFIPNSLLVMASVKFYNCVSMTCLYPLKCRYVVILVKSALLINIVLDR